MLNTASPEQIRHWLEAINQFNDTPGNGTTRLPLTPCELGARDYIKQEMLALGLSVEEDAVGNIFGSLVGTDPSLAPVLTGSHIDTVLNGGMFDGVCGIVAGLESVRMIREAGLRPRRTLKVVVYTSEEGTQYGSGCLGSRTMAGQVSLEDTKVFYSLEGQSLYDRLTETGHDLSKWGDIRREPGDIHAAVELHIEQSGRLEQNKKTVGIVQAICAILMFEVSIYGRQSHAGGTSMDERADAFMAACELALEVERHNKASASGYTTATIGRIEVLPGAHNVIPGRVNLTIDIRDAEYDTKQVLKRQIEEAADRIARERGVRIELDAVENDRPVTCDSGIMALIEQHAMALGVPYMHTFSGAFHDSMFVGTFAPTAMIFVPSKNGISHAPEEWTEFAEIADGVNVLANTLYELCEQP